MKKFKIIVCIFFSITISFWSCNDDEFLKEKPLASYTYASAFNTSSQINDIIAEIYREWRLSFISNVNDGTYFFLCGNGTDMAEAKNPPTPDPQVHSNFSNWSTTYAPSERAFNSFYKMIANANMALYGAELVKWPNENAKNLAVGQALFWRGFSYLNLTELWGGVFIVEEYSETPKFDFQRSTRKESYLFAIADLEAALPLLPDYPEPGRVGKGAVWHYIAEAYLALANDQNNDPANLDKSIAAANEAIKLHSLMKGRFGVRANPSNTGSYQNVPNYFPDGDVFFDLYQRGNFRREQGNTESMWININEFSVYQANTTTLNWNLPWGTIYGPIFRNLQWRNEYREPGSASGPYTMPDLDEFGIGLNFAAHIGGRGQARVQPTNHTSYGVWKNCGDDVRNSPVNIRREFKVLDPKHSFYGTNFRLTIDNVNKYCTEVTAIPNFNPVFTKVCPFDNWGYEGLSVGLSNRGSIYRDHYYLRVAETFLLRAEARLLKGDKAGARSDINEIRSRANAPLVTDAEVNIDYILDERIRELFTEERRWNTLLRMGGMIPSDRIFKYSYWSAERGGTYKLPVNFLLPIPRNVIDSNLDVEIEQNECWKNSQ